MIADILDIEISDIFTKGYEPVGKEQGKQIEAAIVRREQGSPLPISQGNVGLWVWSLPWTDGC